MLKARRRRRSFSSEKKTLIKSRLSSRTPNSTISFSSIRAFFRISPRKRRTGRPNRPNRKRARPIKNRFGEQLLAWYRGQRRKLPWRRSRDPYRIWVSEVMLQQTTVQAVIPYYERWLKVFPDLRSLARAPLRKVLREWQGLGYYQRAGNLHRAAKTIVSEHNGKVPDDESVLRDLPGFGPYTTAAVLSIAYGKPLPVIDANVRRVLMRFLGLRGTAEARTDKKLRAFLET
ncbi:MAG: A/G-specific adenine glycosylase, partial [Candidatus Aminicenantes bacterium]|nr:A/G-specific adenine glycosylase [Candidatus Aminicenantes bacterium]